MWDGRADGLLGGDTHILADRKILNWIFRLHNDSPFRHYAIGIKEQVEVESQWTATKRER
jgi:hypothetical protein